MSSGGGSTSSRYVAGGRPRLTAEDIDGLWALVAVEIYQMLAGLRGWTGSNTKTGWPMSLNACCPARTSATYPLTG